MSNSNLSLRAATPADAECIARIAAVAMPNDPSWDYRHVHRLRYYQDHQCWVQREFKAYSDQPDRYHIDVVTDADNEGDPATPIAFAIWTVNHTVPATICDLGVPFDRSLPCQRNDVHPARFRALRDQLPAADDSFFGLYKNNRLELFVIGTHPLFRGRGAASMLVRAGLDRAHARGVPTTVLAGEAARSFYARCGFGVVGEFDVHVAGEEERVHITAMEHRGSLGPRPVTNGMANGMSNGMTNGHRRLGSPTGRIDDVKADSIKIELGMSR